MEIEEIQEEDPVCEKAYPALDYIWDKDAYGKEEPFRKYEEHARRVLEVVSHLPEYEYKRKTELLSELNKNESSFRFYVLSLYGTIQKSDYKNSFFKKRYLQKLILEEDELWKGELDKKYLEGDLIAKIQQIRQKRQDYFNNLSDKQHLYKQVEEFRNTFAGREESIGDIFEEHCPLCGNNFEGKEISLAQAIRQAGSVFEKTKKILDTIMEEQSLSWKTEFEEVKAQISQRIKDEIGEESVYKDIQGAESHLNLIGTLEKELKELNILMGKNRLAVFLDKAEFGQHYKEINEYEKAVTDPKASIEIINDEIKNGAVGGDCWENEIDKLAYTENKDMIVSLSSMDLRIDCLRKKIHYLEWKRKEKLAIEYSAYNASYETKLMEIRNLYEKNAKLDKILACREDARMEYLNEIMKYLEIPLYIYSGKLIQTHQNGLGLFCFTGPKEDALTEFKMSTDKKKINQRLDVSNKFSTGQKNVANIALMLALRKIAATNLDIFMIDDPCQSLDELNIASFVEIIKNEFTKTQIILSTHEDKIASYMKYKNDKAGKEILMFNVQERLYNISE